jgi:hypothetical protein
MSQLPPAKRSPGGIAAWAGVTALLATAVVTAVFGHGRDTQQNTHDVPAAAPADSRAAISAWWTGGGLDRNSAIGKDFRDMGTATAANDITGLSAACTSLQTDVEAAQAYAPFPDTSAQTDWSTALAQAARSATDCKASTRNNPDADLMTQSNQELDSYTTALNKFTHRVNVLKAGGG